MLRIYRAPSTDPGQTTLQADEGTWAAVIDRLKGGGTNPALQAVLAELRRLGADELARAASPPAHQPGSGPVRRVTVSDLLAQTILAAAQR